MCVLGHLRAVKPPVPSPRSSSHASLVNGGVHICLKSPNSVNIFARNGFDGTQNLIFTRYSTHRPLCMAESTGSPPVLNGTDYSSSVGPDYCELIVVRHGETAWNVDGKIQGHLDVELNEVGREQAVSVAEHLAKELKISVIYSSDLKRALETAQTIANRYSGIKVIEDPDLRERHLGDLQGLVLREAAKVCPIAYRAFLSHRTDQDIPGGGESLDKLYQRCTSALQRIARKHIGERVVVVTHGGVIRTLYKRACPNKKPEGKVLNTSINIFNLTDKNKWILKTWGDVGHLNQTGFLKSGFGGDSTSG